MSDVILHKTITIFDAAIRFEELEDRRVIPIIVLRPESSEREKSIAYRVLDAITSTLGEFKFMQ